MKTASRITGCEGGRAWTRQLLTFCMAFFAACAFAQAPAGGGAPPAYTPARLDQLVAPIALYPDDLIAIILPAATYPLEIIQAERFLEKHKTDKSVKLNDAWQDSVKSLLNYPDVVKRMSDDIDWTADLGEAVVADQGAVMEAIQRFRRKVQSVGNLKSDDKQTVIVEKEVIKVVQANPEVIYVPQYNPTTVVVAGSYPTYPYYPTPYPVYYYPYPPGAAFATGLIWGAAIGVAWSNNHYDCHWGGGGNNNININRNVNINNINNGNINTGNINRNNVQTTAWRSDKKPGQVSSGAIRPASGTRVGDVPRGQGLGDRPATSDRQVAGNRQDLGNRQNTGGRDSNLASSRPSAGTSDRGGSYNNRSGQSRGGDAFGGYGGGSNTRADSSRGAASRNSMPSSGRNASSFQGGSGGGRASAGAAPVRQPAGGGGRSGGGGGRGGRR